MLDSAGRISAPRRTSQRHFREYPAMNSIQHPPYLGLNQARIRIRNGTSPCTWNGTLHFATFAIMFAKASFPRCNSDRGNVLRPTPDLVYQHRSGKMWQDSPNPAGGASNPAADRNWCQ